MSKITDPICILKLYDVNEPILCRYNEQEKYYYITNSYNKIIEKFYNVDVETTYFYKEIEL